MKRNNFLYILLVVLAIVLALLIGADRADAQSPTYHVVQAGDTLSSIAARYGTTVTALKQANGLHGDLIFVGQRLKLSGTATATPTSTARRSFHIVQAGQTWYTIARLYQVTSWSLARYNGQRISDTLLVGQRLNVPPKPQPTPTYNPMWYVR